MSLIELIRYRLRMVKYALTLRPIAGADDDPEPVTDPPGGDDPDKPKGTTDEIDWKKSSRFHESERKKAERRAEEAEKRLAERDEANKTEQEKAIDQARKEAAESVATTKDEEIRTARLESAILRAAAGRFADVDDAARLVDTSNVFTDEGHVDADALKTALDTLLTEKPHLAATTPQGVAPASNPAGKGDAPATSTLEDKTPADWLKEINP